MFRCLVTAFSDCQLCAAAVLSNIACRFVPDELDSLVGVSHAGVLDQGPEYHEEADEEVNIYGLHVGDLRQGGIDRVAVSRESWLQI